MGMSLKVVCPINVTCIVFGMLSVVNPFFILGLHSARIIIDRDSGRSRGFGFITYSSSEEAAAAITAMDSKV